MPTTTTYYSITMPSVGGDSDTWGTINNAALDGLSAELFRVEGLIGGKLSLTGGTLTGALIGTSGAFTTLSGSLTGNVTGNVTGNASTATQLSATRAFSLAGVITSPVAQFNGTQNVIINTSIADGALSIAKTSGLQTALDGKEPTLDADRKRKQTISTADPSGGADGDIWLKYTA